MQSQIGSLNYLTRRATGAIQWVKLEQHHENRLVSNTGPRGRQTDEEQREVAVEWKLSKAVPTLQSVSCEEQTSWENRTYNEMLTDLRLVGFTQCFVIIRNVFSPIFVK